MEEGCDEPRSAQQGRRGHGRAGPRHSRRRRVVGHHQEAVRRDRSGIDRRESPRLPRAALSLVRGDVEIYFRRHSLRRDHPPKCQGRHPPGQSHRERGRDPGHQGRQGNEAVAVRSRRTDHRRLGWSARAPGRISRARRQVRQMARGDRHRPRHPELCRDHDAERCYVITEWMLKTVFEQLYYQKVALEGMVLKPNMVVAGKKSKNQAGVDEVAEKTVKVLKACVPAAVPGIAFLSGGQSDEEATAHLDAINRIGDLPWRVTFSYGRALQAAPQKAWSGRSENVAAAQRAFTHRAMMNSLATRGQWKQDLERKAA